MYGIQTEVERSKSSKTDELTSQIPDTKEERVAKGGESDIAQPRTNRFRTGKRAPEAVHSAKTGHRRLTLQRQPNLQP
ncbi:uncharacterized protein N7511_007862 [Penicillium nucicola]|uniref:uncharacterized protein n=1 Tax=Penicillium nucicola TaxID=1850975 RepID=UPI002544DA0B|nr:uncharacterized protein N7511_007862 [Penicillium nucicola]KAJ5753709.1 hypothetical protein N7511_007862 [Penicillium nucicola]